MEIDIKSNSQTRIYERANSVVFLKTKERFGGLSNMAGGFPLRMNGIPIRTSEALYQACRFPHLPDVQRLIIEQRSPMTAKMRGKPHPSRPDWEAVRVKIMRWCLRVKLAQNWKAFGDLLLKTGDQPIVEQSRRDDFWGAKVMDDGSLVGMNVLGRLLMELREQLKADTGERLKIVEPLLIPDFLLFQQPIRKVYDGEYHDTPETAAPTIADPSPLSVLDQPVTHKNCVDIQHTAPSKQETKKGLQPYPTYKPSGVEWLGEVPEHWEVRRLKYLLYERDIRSIDGTEQLLRVSQYTGVTERKNEYGTDKPDTRAASLVNYKCVSPNELVVNIMLAWNGSMGISRFQGIVSPAYCVYRFNNIAVSWYFHNLLRSPRYKARIKAVSTGVVESRLRLYTDDLYRLDGLLPPLPEQTAIVRYLDYFDRRIRRYIDAKQKLIKLLEEQKQVVIHRAVTRGLDPDVPLKPSGVEWLGEVPKHWGVWKLKAISSREQNGATPPTDEPEYYSNGGVPWYSPPSLSFQIEIGKPARYVSHRAVDEGKVRVISPPALAVLVIGNVGRCALLHQIGTTNQQITCFELIEKVCDPRFIVYQFRFAESSLIASASSATIAILNSTVLRSTRLTLPPLPEQTAIVKYLDKTTADLDTAITRACRGIDLLQEYRTRLIADVVTGKLDVRESAAALPDESVPLSG